MNIASLRLGSAIALLIPFASAPASAESASKDVKQRPNILWLTLEDSSAYQFSCYGNEDISTPAIDRLAEQGVRFANASSTAPQCSAARSSLITGCPATTYGMDYHRKAVQTPDDIFFPIHLKDAGYYCVNNKKAHWNSTSAALGKQWNERGLKATYASPQREPGQPFFAVFNFGPTHMSRFRTMTLEGRRDMSHVGIVPEKLFLPPYLPDLPAFRSDQALMLERSLEADAWLGAFRLDLKSKGLDEDTVIFFFSDHGGSMPRGKGYPFETGFRIPLVMYVPPKWQAEFGVEPGTTDAQPIGFEDLGPTVLSMAGVEPPAHMQGKAFFGAHTNRGEKQGLQFNFRTNQGEHYDPNRTVTDGRYKYIRNYMPHKPFSLRNLFQWGVPSNLAWDDAVLSGSIKDPKWSSLYHGKPSEMLFDLERDPWELNNLAQSQEHDEVLSRFRQAVSQRIRETRDLGFFPIDLRDQPGGPHQFVRKGGFPLESLHNAAELASMPGAGDRDKLIALLRSEHPALRYWGAVGFCTLGSRREIEECPAELLECVQDESPVVAIAAADAASYLGRGDVGQPRLLEIMATRNNLSYSSLEAQTWHAAPKQALKQRLPQLKEWAETSDQPTLAQWARSLLINLGELPVEELYTAEEWEAAAKLNHEAPITDYAPYLRELDPSDQAGG